MLLPVNSSEMIELIYNTLFGSDTNSIYVRNLFHICNGINILRKKDLKDAPMIIGMFISLISLYGAGTILNPMIFQKPPSWLMDDTIILGIFAIWMIFSTFKEAAHALCDFPPISLVIFTVSMAFNLHSITNFVKLALELLPKATVFSFNELPLVNLILIGTLGGCAGSVTRKPSAFYSGIPHAVYGSLFCATFIVFTVFADPIPKIYTTEALNLFHRHITAGKVVFPTLLEFSQATLLAFLVSIRVVLMIVRGMKFVYNSCSSSKPQEASFVTSDKKRN